MLQILPIVLALVKAVNASGNLLNNITQIAYSFIEHKKSLTKVYNNIIKSI